MQSSSLPEIIPVFPLTGIMLLPGMWLPLHIFEPRYRHMIADAVGVAEDSWGGAGKPANNPTAPEPVREDATGVIGMVQPLVPRQDNRPSPEALANPHPEEPELYTVGCVGRIERWERTPDGRYAIALKGVSRFRITGELPLLKGYRRVRASYDEFKGDTLESDPSYDPSRLMAALDCWKRGKSLPMAFGELRKLHGLAALNTLAMSLPLAPVEKQALLEAPTHVEREKLLLELLEMGIEERGETGNVTPPKSN
ncbi:MAG: hypothetical protein FVQ81_17680 [Candidatus Glassbacteria bacterium]|nr:hypothetical protein [Candidatus Glassbacteria bacterium]